MSNVPGFDAEYPPTNPVPSGYQWAGIYVGGINVSRVTPAGEQTALEAAGLKLLPIYVGRNSCPGCTGNGMTAAQGTADGQEFVRQAETRGFTGAWLLAFDWEANTETLPGFAAYANAAAQAVRDGGHLVAHYGTTTILDQITVADAVWLTYWTNNTTEDGLTSYWRGKQARFAWQYGGANPLDYDVATPEFVDALGVNMIAGPNQPAAPTSETFPDYGGPHVIGGGIYQAWKAAGGVAGPGLPLNDEHPFTGVDGKTYTAQDFERARAEWSADVQALWNVQWGLVNLELLAARAALAKTTTPVIPNLSVVRKTVADLVAALNAIPS